MSHQDRTLDIVINHKTIKQAVDWLLPPMLFVRMKVRKGATWSARMLAAAALLWATSDRPTLQGRFEHARKIVKKVFRWMPAPGATYQGFMKVLRKWHVELMLSDHSLRADADEGGIARTVGDRRVCGLCGRRQSRGTGTHRGVGTCLLPKTFPQSERQATQAKRGGDSKGSAKRRTAKKKKQSKESLKKKANSPQMWLTLFWHVGTGLPWTWRTGPSDSSERAHLEEMLGELPKSSLITADAGFVGYDFWTRVLQANHHFVIRVGGNVRLLKKLGYRANTNIPCISGRTKLPKRATAAGVTIDRRP